MHKYSAMSPKTFKQFYWDRGNSKWLFTSYIIVKRIKVLRIINRFNIGGPTYNATFLTRFMDERFETLLVGGLPDIGESDSLYIPENYGVQPMLIEELVRIPNIKSDRKAYKKLKEIIEEFKPDIVHTHASKAGALGRRAAISLNVPVVVHTFHGHVFHSYFGWTKTQLFKNIERSLARKTDAIIAISEKQGHELVREHKICKEERLKVVPLGFDLEDFHNKRLTKRDEMRGNLGLKDDEIAVGIIGRLAPIKDHDFFFDVLETVLKETTKKVKVFVVGDGIERERLEKRAGELNEMYNNNILFTSWVKDIGSFNAAMDIICLTSKNEGTPVSLIEAQAANIPVISTDVGGVRDVVLNNETGYIVQPGDKKTFEEKLLELIENEKKREYMSQNGWNFVREKFHYTTLVKNMEGLYLDLLEKKKQNNA